MWTFHTNKVLYSAGSDHHDEASTHVNIHLHVMQLIRTAQAHISMFGQCLAASESNLCRPDLASAAALQL